MERDPYKYFRVEAKELADRLSRGVLELGRGANGKEAVTPLLRLAHTLKGAAHVVKQGEIAKLAHQIEDVLLPYAGGQSPVPPDSVKGLLHAIDGIAAEVARLGPSQPQPAASEAPAAVDEEFDTLRIDIAEMDTLLEGINEVSVQLAGLKTKLAALDEAANLASLLRSHLTAQPATPNARGTGTIAKAKSLAEDLHSLNRSASDSVSAAVEQIQGELAQVRDTASQLRLVPASIIFMPLQRAVRNAAEALAKQVEFTASGGEHRLDAHVLAAMRDLLMHLVRNAVAHGMEPAAVRMAAGKAAVGKIRLSVERRGNRVSFACQDDGRGFDLAALRRVAVARQLLSPDEANALGSAEIIRLIFRGGVSTTRAADEVSGHGIGLDTVRQTAASLKADLNVHTDPGAGTTVEVCVPVSLLSLEAITVESGGVRISVPLDAVQQTLRLRTADVARHPAGEAVLFEGKSIPYVPLWRALRSPAPPARTRGAMTSAVVIQAGGELAALGVDRLLGTGTVVLRPIPSFAGVDAVVAGVSLNAEGNPQLVLDPAALLAAAGTQDGLPESPVAAPRPVVLVVDDSLTSRMLEQSILESAGFEVDVAACGEDALEKCRDRRYNLFIVDVEMPGMDGFEFVARTQNDSVLRTVPSVLVTSRSSPQDRQRGKDVGARAYMVKAEFDQGTLLRTIRQLVS